MEVVVQAAQVGREALLLVAQEGLEPLVAQHQMLILVVAGVVVLYQLQVVALVRPVS